MSNIPKDLEKIIAEIIAHKKIKEEQLEHLYDYMYEYDYSEYPEYDDNESEEKSTIIKISL